MSIPPKKYRPIGLRRDRNLSDVPNANTSLNNLLNDLEGEGSFITEDLDVVRGLRTLEITANTLYDLSSISVLETPIDGGNPVVSEPLVTIKDRIEFSKLTSGPVPAFNGGQGPYCRFVPTSRIREGNTSSTGSDIFYTYNIPENSEIPKEIYWELGGFNFADKIDFTFENQFGGLQWEGYFSPYIYDPYVNIYIKTTGLVIAEFDELDNGNYQQLICLYNKDRNVEPLLSVSATNVITFANSDLKYIAVNDYVNNSLSNRVLEINYSVGIDVDNIPYGTVSLSGNIDTGLGPIKFSKDLGQDETTNRFVLPSVEPGNYHKIRFSVWFPYQAEAQNYRKLIEFSYIGVELQCTHLYATKPPPTVNDSEEIRDFLNKAVSPYNTKIGNANPTGTKGTYYKGFNSSKPFLSSYVPKSSVAEIITTGDSETTRLSYKTGSNIITRVSGKVMSLVRVGNYIVPNNASSTNITNDMQVKGFLDSDNVRFINKPFNTTNINGEYVNFIDDRGLIAWYVANTSSTGNTVTISSTSDLRKGYIVIHSSTLSTDFVRIRRVINSTSFSLTKSLGNNTNTLVYVYSDKGIIDASKDAFCTDVFGKMLNGYITQSTTDTLPFTDVTGVEVGQVAQLDGYIANDPYPTVESINTLTKQITFNRGFIVLKDIPSNATVTFAPPGTTQNVEKCVIPLDTSFPFVSTLSGIRSFSKSVRSKSTVPSFNVEIIKFSANLNNSNIETSTGTVQYDRRLPIIRLGSDTFSILCKTI